MTDPDTKSTAPVVEEEGVRQVVPAVIRVAPSPAAADARDALLDAIGKEARVLADTHPGQASQALRELAHAYALVTTATPTIPDTFVGANRNGRADMVIAPTKPSGGYESGDYTGQVHMVFDAVVEA
ncbi:hypothetical protein [Embleya sp. NPDC050493]|uniref:hypothetical protein n=1 Tax=Embleya sp. NPDC050493 TaxID=3363989 RepID=UPI0037BD4516